MIRKFLFVAVVGLSLAPLGATQTFAQKPTQVPGLGLRPDLTLRQQGLLVTGVIPGSPAAMQGVEAGDIIVTVNGNPVRSLADLNFFVGSSRGAVQLGVMDARTGWLNQVWTTSINGRIGVAVQPVPLGGVGAGIPAVGTLPVNPGIPCHPGTPGINPLPAIGLGR
jgi:membrane-associated protease RseP (regulator of RpoE activity)